ncbi:MAG: peptidylprolyl isomerase [Longimicrobiales bacterium]
MKRSHELRLVACGLATSLLLAGCDLGYGCSKDSPAGSALLTNPGADAFHQTAPDSFIARFETSRGSFAVQVVRAWAPRGADRFYTLVRNGFYDGNRFFRVIPGFVVQWGINGDPGVSQAWARQCIPDDAVRQGNTRRAMSFAFGRPHTRTTQVFVNYGMNPRLNELGFAAFGEVIDGMVVLDSLYGAYGEGPPRGAGPDPVKVGELGNAYLDSEFPRLDSIIRARVVSVSKR